MPTWVLTSAEVAIAYGVDQVGSILPALELLPFDSNAGKVDQTWSTYGDGHWFWKLTSCLLNAVTNKLCVIKTHRKYLSNENCLSTFHVLKSYPLSGYLLYKESPITHSVGLVSLLTTRFILYFRCYDSLHDSVPTVPIVNCLRYRNNTITLLGLKDPIISCIMMLRVGCQWLAHITWLWDKEEVLSSFFYLMVWIPRTCMSGATAKHCCHSEQRTQNNGSIIPQSMWTQLYITLSAFGKTKNTNTSNYTV